jgi:hypothetical protein
VRVSTFFDRTTHMWQVQPSTGLYKRKVAFACRSLLLKESRLGRGSVTGTVVALGYSESRLAPLVPSDMWTVEISGVGAFDRLRDDLVPDGIFEEAGDAIYAHGLSRFGFVVLTSYGNAWALTADAI